MTWQRAVEPITPDVNTFRMSVIEWSPRVFKSALPNLPDDVRRQGPKPYTLEPWCVEPWCLHIHVLRLQPGT